jgi:putative membrane protein
MLTDLLLAAFHHLLFFGLVSMLVTQSVLLRGRIDGAVLARLGGIDRGYGITAVLLLVVGLLRVFYGIKGYDFYLHNPWFHAKIGAFVLVGVLSIWPTVRFLRWRKAIKADPGFLPSAAEVAGLQRIIRFELILVAAIFVCAAAMARYGGF